MKIAMYVNDKGGLKTYSKYLVDALKKKKVSIKTTNNFKESAQIYHIQFESSLFHPFGMGVIPKLLYLKLKKKKVIITFHTVLSKKEIYARNRLFKFIKKLTMPLGNTLICKISDRAIVHREKLKQVLVNDYHANKDKIRVISHGAY